LRQFIDDAAKPLQALLDYFAGRIDNPPARSPAASMTGKLP
jgi:hypothetical protein